jgi:glycosyltransferase involved in cell wall biosynthesis
MNKGFAMATGDVIGILNSDDFFTSEDVLQTVVDGFAGEYVDAVYADIHFVGTDDLTKCVRYYSSSVFRPWMMRFGMIPAHPSFYCRKAVYDQYGSFDTTYRIAADFEILLRLIFIHRIRTRYVKKDFVTMRLGGASTTGYGSWSLIMKEHLQIMKQHGVVTNRFLLSLRYIYKLFEFL